jgi:hypothetical protein
MAPAEGEDHIALLGQGSVSAVAVNLQDALEAGQMLGRPPMLAIGGVDVDRRRRIAACKRPLVAGITPELAGLGAAAAGIEHGSGRLVSEQLGGGLEVLEQPVIDPPQREGAAADLIRQRCAIQIDPLAGIDLGLPIQGQ